MWHKLQRYLKSIFPKAEETMILDLLANKDNNVQKASEELIRMGFARKENTVQQKKENNTPALIKKVVIMKTTDDKNALVEKLQKKFPSVPERVVTIALESAMYNEERADQILTNVLKEEACLKAKVAELMDSRRPSYVETKKPPILKSSGKTESKYKSQYYTPTNGPNSSLRQGPKDSLLLDDYIPWTGPDPLVRFGKTACPVGPGHRQNTVTLARGPSALAKGPGGIAKGSIYQKPNKKTAKIIG